MITSARQGKAVNKEDLMQHELTIHSFCEQEQISQCFKKLYNRLKLERERLKGRSRCMRGRSFFVNLHRLTIHKI